MKRILVLILLLVILFPFDVNAESFEYQIVVDVDLENRDIKEDEFTFELIDSDGNIIQTKKNSQDGRVYFDSISFTPSDVNINGCQSCLSEIDYGYRLYIVKQVIENENVYTYDKDEVYVGVYFFENGTSEIHYLKDVDETIEGWSYRTQRDSSKIFHATEEQLQGEAYAVFNRREKTLTFFRDEPGKYYDNQYECTGNEYNDCVVYYTNFENSNLYAPWSNYIGIKKIIFKDPIRPRHIARTKDLSEWGSHGGGSWFYSLDDLEEIENINLLDTSLIESFNSLFSYNHKLKEVDLSSWDTSNVQDMHSMFSECDNLEKVEVYNFDTSNVVHFDYMFYKTKIQLFDPSLFDTSKLMRAHFMFGSNDGLKALDLSSWKIGNWYGTSSIVQGNKSLRFLDISSFENITSNGIANLNNLSILRMAGSYNIFSSSFGMNDAFWYNTNNNVLYDRESLKHHLVELKDLETATYVRPYNNSTPSVFVNKYIGFKELSVELKITSKEKSLLSLFDNTMTLQEPFEWTIKNSSILRIENNTIIPLKVGETDVTTTINNIDYIIHVIVVSEDIIVPDTLKNSNNEVSLLNFLLIILSLGIWTAIYEREKSK